MTPPRPGEVCRELLAALEASEGRRKRRKRDTTPDAIGLAIKRDLLDRAVAADPDPDEFEAWLLEQCAAAGPAEGGMRAMALSIFEEWRLALSAGSFGDWLAQGAPSDDASRDGPTGREAANERLALHGIGLARRRRLLEAPPLGSTGTEAFRVNLAGLDRDAHGQVAE